MTKNERFLSYYEKTVGEISFKIGFVFWPNIVVPIKLHPSFSSL